MGLSAKVKKLVQQAIKKVDDLASRVTYVSVSVGSYTVATDAVAKTETTYANVPCVQTKLVEDDLEWFPANMKGQKLLIAYNDLPIVVTDDDYVLIGGVKWEIVKIREVPGNSLWILFVKAT